MFSTAILDLFFGLGVLFLFSSLICSAAAELLSALFWQRASILRVTLEQMLGAETKKAVYHHPLILALHHPAQFNHLRPPSYIPPRLFALALLDVLTHSFNGVLVPTDASVRTGLVNLVKGDEGELLTNTQPVPRKQTNGRIARAVLAVRDDAVALGADVAAAAAAADAAGDSPPAPPDVLPEVSSLMAWYHDVMERATGSYKRRMQWILLLVAYVFCMSVNIDCLSYGKTLWTDATKRAALTDAIKRTTDAAEAQAKKQSTEAQTAAIGAASAKAAAEKALQAATAQATPEEKVRLKNALDSATKTNEKAQKDLAVSLGENDAAARAAIAQINKITDLEVPFPFGNSRGTFKNPLMRLVPTKGILLSIFAISLGAPFWYDLLGRITNLRSTGRVPLPDPKSLTAYGTSVSSATDAAQKAVSPTPLPPLSPQTPPKAQPSGQPGLPPPS